MLIRKIPIGLISLYLLTLSACSSAPIKTESVTVYQPVYIALPQDLTRQVPEPNITVKTNSDLADLAIAFQIALKQANSQLQSIKEIQP